MNEFSTLPKLPFEVPKAILDKASKIKLALFDVDGVLTDGSLHYGPNGEELKTFNALDGHGLKMLQMAGIKVGIISARKSKALERRLKDLGIAEQHLGVHNKLEVFESLLSKDNLTASECSFVGDDVIDLAVMLQCGLKITVSNGHFVIKHFADWCAPFAGGAGAVRAVCDLILYSRKQYPLNTAPLQ